VAITGSGAVASADKAISCGSKCVSNQALGTVVNLTARAGSNSTFTGWSGGGGGGTPQFTPSVGRSNAGSVTSDVAGINCGSNCSAKFNSLAAVVLTATPPAGKPP
jgi:hypothetical protein